MLVARLTNRAHPCSHTLNAGLSVRRHAAAHARHPNMHSSTRTMYERQPTTPNAQLCLTPPPPRARTTAYVLGNIHLYDDPDAFSAGPTVRSHVSNSPAMRAMFGVVGGFLLLVGGVVAWGNRHYCCPRKHRYQRVSTNNRV